MAFFAAADVDANDGKGSLKQQLHRSGMNDPFWRDCKFFGTLILIDSASVSKTAVTPK
jgi:hypothetical protein